MAKRTGSQKFIYYNPTAISSTDAQTAVEAAGWANGTTSANGTLARSRGEIAYVNRENGGQTQYFPGVRDEALSFSIASDFSDPFFAALFAAFNSDVEASQKIAMAVTDGVIGTDGTRVSYMANFVVLEFPEDLDQSKIVDVAVSCRPSDFITRGHTVAAA